MNIVLAQIKKDVLCQKAVLIVWGICVMLGIVAIAVLGVLSHGPKLDIENQRAALGILLSVGGLSMIGIGTLAIGMFLLVPILVVLIVQEDPLMGTTAFWLTRPVPREKLLAAKAILIAVLPLPMLFIGGTNARLNDAQGWLTELATISAFAAVAAITPSIRAFFLYAVALVLGRAIFTGILESLWNRFQGNSSAYSYGAAAHPYSVITETLHINPVDLFHLCYFIGFSAAFVHQYLTLRTKISLGILIATIFVVSVLQTVMGAR